MMRTQEAWLLVHVTDWTEVSTNDLKVRVLPDKVHRHLEHPQMEEGHWTEGAACDEDEGLLVGVAERAVESVRRKLVIWRVCEGGG